MILSRARRSSGNRFKQGRPLQVALGVVLLVLFSSGVASLLGSNESGPSQPGCEVLQELDQIVSESRRNTSVMTAKDFAARSRVVADYWGRLRAEVPASVRPSVAVLQEDFQRYLSVFEQAQYDVAKLQQSQSLADYLDSRDTGRITSAMETVGLWVEDACDYTPRSDGPFVPA